VAATGLEEKYDAVRQLIAIGKSAATCCTTR
jgi:hypothetical protein